MHTPASSPPPRASMLNDPKVRGLVFQVLAIAAVIAIGWYLFDNTQTNLAQRGITSGFDFLDRSAGFGILQALIPYTESDTYGRVFLVGLLNTLLVAVLGIVLATMIGFIVGIAPTANLNPEREFPSMFEPIHGSAFDIMGKGIANPIGTFWSNVMLLEHIGEDAAAARLMKAIERVTANPRFHTPDLGGKARTVEVTAAVIDAIGAENA